MWIHKINGMGSLLCFVNSNYCHSCTWIRLDVQFRKYFQSKVMPSRRESNVKDANNSCLIKFAGFSYWTAIRKECGMKRNHNKWHWIILYHLCPLPPLLCSLFLYSIYRFPCLTIFKVLKKLLEMALNFNRNYIILYWLDY